MTEAPKDYPQYPLYIISKGRADSMITSRSLSRMKIYHYIAIEPQDEDPYKKALKKLLSDDSLNNNKE